jgi:hypothetical protein
MPYNFIRPKNSLNAWGLGIETDTNGTPEKVTKFVPPTPTNWKEAKLSQQISHDVKQYTPYGHSVLDYYHTEQVFVPELDRQALAIPMSPLRYPLFNDVRHPDKLSFTTLYQGLGELLQGIYTHTGWVLGDRNPANNTYNSKATGVERFGVFDFDPRHCFKINRIEQWPNVKPHVMQRFQSYVMPSMGLLLGIQPRHVHNFINETSREAVDEGMKLYIDTMMRYECRRAQVTTRLPNIPQHDYCHPKIKRVAYTAKVGLAHLIACALKA